MKNSLTGISKNLPLAITIVTALGCSKGNLSFSTLATTADFRQEAVYVPKKIDILWVIDNSGSMATSQANLINNFQSFIGRFTQFNYDFHMAVATTDAWEKQFIVTSQKAKLRDGAVLVSGQPSTHSGFLVMDKNTPNLSTVFETNIRQGTLGNGDERAFESIYQTLNNETFNTSTGFRRSDAFLAVIIVSDEDDFSNSTVGLIENYSDSRLYPISKYTDFLDAYTGGLTAGRNYSVNSISVVDESCKATLNNGAQKVSNRYQQISDLTGGVKGSLCSNFGETLQLISDTIIQLSSSFKLNREPIPETLIVMIDNQVVANDATNGWTYDSVNLVITFHGSAIPQANSSVSINFDPKTIKL